MKQNLVKAIVVALFAATGVQTVDAQSQVANNRRERILQVLDQSRPNEYVPAGFFLHFENKLGRKAVEDHKAFYKATNRRYSTKSACQRLTSRVVRTGRRCPSMARSSSLPKLPSLRILPASLARRHSSCPLFTLHSRWLIRL